MEPLFRLRGLATGVALATVIAALPLTDARAQSAPPGPPQVEQSQPASNPALDQVRQILERFGTIGQHPRYGEVWLPGTVPEGWSPYPPCNWAYDRQSNAWNYQDSTEWGQIVHHYGRWAFDQQSGWMWIADGNYGPGWVYWKNEGGAVSWAALAPEADGVPVPVQGWHSQDQQTFNAGCRSAAPPPPVASGPPPAPPRPVYAAPSGPPPVYAPRPPVYGGGPPPVYVPAPPVYAPVGPPVIVDGPLRPPPIVVVIPGRHCDRFPMSPACRGAGPRPGPGSGTGPGTGPGAGPGTGPKPGPGTGPGQGPGQGPVAGPGTGPKPGTGPAPDPLKPPFQTQKDAKAACEATGNPAACKSASSFPASKVFSVAPRPNRQQLASPFMRPKGGMRPGVGMRPNRAFGPVRVAGTRPNFRPGAFRPRPMAGRPSGARPSMQRPGGGFQMGGRGLRMGGFGGQRMTGAGPRGGGGGYGAGNRGGGAGAINRGGGGAGRGFTRFQRSF